MVEPWLIDTHCHLDPAWGVEGDAASFDEALEAELERLLRDQHVVAVGKVGLDSNAREKVRATYVVHTARRLAELRNLPFERLARLTSENACRRFGPALAGAARLCQTQN